MAAKKSLKARWQNLSCFISGHKSFLIRNVNLWGILSSAQVQNFCENYNNSIFPISNTQDEKNYTADSARIRPYRHKILSNSPNGFTFCSQMIHCYYKNISSCNHFKLIVQFGFILFSSCSWWLALMHERLIFTQLDLTWIVETESCVSLMILCLFFSFSFFGLINKPTNMCKLNILVHLKYKWLKLYFLSHNVRLVF